MNIEDLKRLAIELKDERGGLRTRVSVLADAVLALIEQNEKCLDSLEAQAGKHRGETIMWAEHNLALRENLVIATEALKYYATHRFTVSINEKTFACDMQGEVAREALAKIAQLGGAVEEKE